MRYDDIAKITSLTVKLDPTFDPYSKYTFYLNISRLTTPDCPNYITDYYDSDYFSVYYLVPGPDISPEIIFDTLTAVPMCTPLFKLSSTKSMGVFAYPATYEWSVTAMIPLSTSIFDNLTSIAENTDSSILSLDAWMVAQLAGRVVTFELALTNFIGYSSNEEIAITFEDAEGLLLKEVNDHYTVNPSKNFTLTPKVSLSACTITEETRARRQELRVLCEVFIFNTTVNEWRWVSFLNDCTIPAGIMKHGYSYEVTIVGYDPQGRYAENITKDVPINLAKPQIIAKISGGDRVISASDSLTLTLDGQNLEKSFVYNWKCKDLDTGIGCINT